VPPFDHADIWTGNASLASELVAQLAGKPAAIVLSVGGGGLLCGVLQGLHQVCTLPAPLMRRPDGRMCLWWRWKRAVQTPLMRPC
jgi:threonine dehydratase